MTQTVLTVKASLISGVGLFANTTIEQGKIIFLMFNLDLNGIYTKQIEPINFLNHSKENNIVPYVSENSVFACAKNTIYPNTELTVDYFEFEKWGLKTGIEKILNNPVHYQNLYNANRHKLMCDKPIGYQYIF